MAESQWSEKLIAKWRDRDVPSQIDELQLVYKKWIIVCALITGGGAAMMMTTPNPRVIALGLFLAITGMVNVVLMKIWAHIKLSMLRVVWELQKEREAHSG
jgi:hypothetical protein